MTSTNTSNRDNFTLNIIRFISRSDLSYSESAGIAESIMYSVVNYEYRVYNETCDTYEEMLHARYIADELLKAGVTTEYTVCKHEYNDDSKDGYYIVSSALNLD